MICCAIVNLSFRFHLRTCFVYRTPNKNLTLPLRNLLMNGAGFPTTMLKRYTSDALTNYLFRFRLFVFTCESNIYVETASRFFYFNPRRSIFLSEHILSPDNSFCFYFFCFYRCRMFYSFLSSLVRLAALSKHLRRFDSRFNVSF